MKLVQLLIALIGVIAISSPSLADDKPLSLEDLGFKKGETTANPELQFELEKRPSMLQTVDSFWKKSAL